VLVGCASLRRHYPDQVLRVAANVPLSVETPPAIFSKLDDWLQPVNPIYRPQPANLAARSPDKQDTCVNDVIFCLYQIQNDIVTN